jgi:alkyl hydroperoxide reductase subunit F
MLDANMQQQLKPTFENLKTPVELLVFSDEGEKSKELKALASDLAGLSPLISLVEEDNATARRPSLQVRGKGAANQVYFAGVPMGHEFTSLILAILHNGGHAMKIEADLIEQVRTLEGEFRFETYISLSCQTCPEVVQSLNMMAAINPCISHVMIDGSEFQDEVDERKVMAVPMVFLNGELFSQGRIGVEKVLHKIDSKAGERQAEKLSEKAAYDLLIVGGGPAGAAAAIYSARKGIRTGIVTERFGGQVLETMSIENFISVKSTDGPAMVAHLEEHVREYEVDIISNQLCNNLIPAQTEGGLIAVELESGARLQSRSVILATGARWREINVPGEKQYLGKGVAYCPHCDGPLFKGKRVAVVGGGNSGIEAAIDLAGIVSHVTVLEFDNKLRADDVLQEKAASLGNIDIITSAMTTEITGNGEKVSGLNYTDRTTEETKSIALEGIFVQIGLLPNTGFLKGTVALSAHGEVVIGAQGETDVAGVFAAGDVTTVPFKQIIIAMGSGATAALGAFDYMIRTPETQSKNVA